MWKYLDEIKDGFTSNTDGGSHGLQLGFPFWWDDQACLIVVRLIFYNICVWSGGCDVQYDFWVHNSGLSADMEIEP